MKRTIFLLLSLFCLSANAQIFNHISTLDKFDDVISSRKAKTLIQKYDNSIVIEEKGKKPVTYSIVFKTDDPAFGNKDSIVNLIEDIYGYQECWFAVLDSNMDKYVEGLNNIKLVDDAEKQKKMFMDLTNKYVYSIYHRVVTTKYTHDFVTELFWVSKGDNNGRTIYENW